VRTFEEINGDVRHAMSFNDAVALLRSAEELEALDAPAAWATAHIARGAASRVHGRYPEALKHFHRALEVLTELGDRAGMAHVTGHIGTIHVSIGRYPAALEYFHSALEMFAELGDRAGVAPSTSNIGAIHASTGRYPEALEHYHRALEMYAELGDRASVARIHGNIGRVHANTGAYPEALEHYHLALEAHTQLGNRDGAAHVTGIIGNVHLYTGRYPEALEHFYRALELFTELENSADVAVITGNIITALVKEEQYAEAEALLLKMGTVQISEPAAAVEREMNRASIYEHHGQLEDAKAALNAGLQVADQHGIAKSRVAVHERLRELSLKQNDLASYVEHNNEFLRISGEISGQEATRRLAMIESEKRIAAERAEKEKHKALLYNTLPPTIADRVLQGEIVNDSHDMAAVMFMDMVGFTTMSSAMEANDVVKLFSEVFTTCDAIMAEHGMMKIKTIGDSYMAVAIEPNTEDRKPNTMYAVSDAANAAVQVLKRLTEQHPEIRVRIGLYCGPVTAGVIGTERLQYDVWATP
jgi:class 3 adenylate cyclase